MQFGVTAPTLNWEAFQMQQLARKRPRWHTYTRVSLNYIFLMWDWTMLGPENEKGLFYDKTGPGLLTW